MLRELDERTSDNLRVTLYWEDSDNTFTVQTEDFTNPELNRTITGVPTGDRVKAFYHPYTYTRGES